jgi:hypothetical protein
MTRREMTDASIIIFVYIYVVVTGYTVSLSAKYDEHHSNTVILKYSENYQDSYAKLLLPRMKQSGPPV